MAKSPYDLNRDGLVSDQEARLIELENKDRKADSQRRMAWIALLAAVITVIVLVGPWIPVERIAVLDGVLSTFFLAMASIVGFFFGAQAYMSRNDHSGGPY